MQRIIVGFLASFFQSLAVTIVTFSQLPKKLDNKKYIFFFIIYLYCLASFFVIPNQLRFLIFILVISLNIYFTLKIVDKSVLLYAFNTEMIFTISEIIITLLLVLVGTSSEAVVNNYLFNLIANILISFFSIFIINIKLIRKLINNILILFNKNKRLYKYLYIFLFILYLILNKNGMEFLLKSNYYLNVLFIICIIVVITLVVKSESKYDKLQEENKQMLNYVTKYEKIITQQGKANHEFKNQLMVIRGYAQINSKRLIEYIDSITEDTKKTQSSYMIRQLNNFPEGGIKGLLYYKLSIMDDEKIKYELDVESGVKTKLNNLPISMYKNITKVLGVLLDNAIEASKKSKSKKIIISVMKEKTNVIFTISNTYKGKLDLSKIGTGYTSKGIGHGYGLRLVKDIISETNYFELNNDIRENMFITNLKICINNKKIDK